MHALSRDALPPRVCCLCDTHSSGIRTLCGLHNYLHLLTQESCVHRSSDPLLFCRLDIRTPLPPHLFFFLSIAGCGCRIFALRFTAPFLTTRRSPFILRFTCLRRADISRFAVLFFARSFCAFTSASALHGTPRSLIHLSPHRLLRISHFRGAFAPLPHAHPACPASAPLPGFTLGFSLHHTLPVTLAAPLPRSVSSSRHALWTPSSGLSRNSLHAPRVPFHCLLSSISAPSPHALRAPAPHFAHALRARSYGSPDLPHTPPHGSAARVYAHSPTHWRLARSHRLLLPTTD